MSVCKDLSVAAIMDLIQMVEAHMQEKNQLTQGEWEGFIEEADSRHPVNLESANELLEL